MPIPDVTDRPIDELLRLDGRIAVVTGGANGIGRAIAGRFVDAGAKVLIADIDDAAASATAARIFEQRGGTVETAHVDVRETAQLDALAARALELFGRIDIWVNNAGIFPATDFLNDGDEQYDLLLDLNARGAYMGARAAARHMVERGGGGVIINLTSINSYRAFGPGVPHYAASKHAVMGITKALAVELGQYNIRVVSLSPTMIETEGVQGLRGNVDEAFAAGMENMVNLHAAGRIGVPDDVARCAVFLASDMAMYVTGSDVVVDGGYLAR